VIRNRTLGSDGAHGTLYEQHNPDYIPRQSGGPAVLVAGSENNRVVEYQRTQDGWTRTWMWQDLRLQWPRDADRLPNGNTMITDTNGGRVLEVAPNGSVVWSVEVAFPYEAERLGTGDESEGGPSARRERVDSRNADRRNRETPPNETDTTAPDRSGSRGTTGLVERVLLRVKGLVSGPAFSAVNYVLPNWVGPLQLLGLVGLLVALPLWGVIEWRWRRE
jgi:hypothetical protein